MTYESLNIYERLLFALKMLYVHFIVHQLSYSIMHQKLKMPNELPIVHAADVSSITTAHLHLKNTVAWITSTAMPSIWGNKVVSTFMLKILRYYHGRTCTINIKRDGSQNFFYINVSIFCNAQVIFFCECMRLAVHWLQYVNNWNNKVQETVKLFVLPTSVLMIMTIHISNMINISLNYNKRFCTAKNNRKQMTLEARHVQFTNGRIRSYMKHKVDR